MKRHSDLLTIISPIIIIVFNICSSFVFKYEVIEWSFIPITMIEWMMIIFFISMNGGTDLVTLWLKRPSKNWLLSIVSLLIVLLYPNIFSNIKNFCGSWMLVTSYILIAVLNPFFEEFYWRGLLTDITPHWNATASTLYSNLLFTFNYVVLQASFRQSTTWEMILFIFITSIIWCITYQKTNSLRWVILSHFVWNLFTIGSFVI
ncbi:hypothetical protein SAMN05444409_2060 [Epilithonimonas zeae]|uniref:CAAX prenyl protease 2/Lysostaphin resistance protein A-like domain-containing protein n=2 Tax=Epilithonimonas zeae TaxID=1416779 RepID=A0A1N6GUI5_9FLAO|nr:hypothetical protein SAMN05444409_2060 [Epilithonimonas zeae]